MGKIRHVAFVVKEPLQRGTLGRHRAPVWRTGSLKREEDGAWRESID